MSWRNIVIGAFFAGLSTIAGLAIAQIVGSLPFVLQNNTLADATQVMADFNKIVNDTNANAAKNGVNADITQLAALVTPINAGQGGSTTYIGGTSTGSANLQAVASIIPAGFAIGSFKKVVFVAGFGNTGALFINVAGSGSAPVTRPVPGGVVALGGGEVVAGMIVEVREAGGSYQLLNSALPMLPGTSMVYRGGSVPAGFLAEDGSCVAQATYPALFSIIGVNYGACGAGNFNLPDSRGRVDAGLDGGTNRLTTAGSGVNGTSLGAAGGAQNVTLPQSALANATLALTGNLTNGTITVQNQAQFTTNAQPAGAGFSTYSVGGSSLGFTAVLASTALTGTTASINGGVTQTATTTVQPTIVATKMVRY